jgi:hypothetical protein
MRQCVIEERSKTDVCGGAAVSKRLVMQKDLAGARSNMSEGAIRECSWTDCVRRS